MTNEPSTLESNSTPLAESPAPAPGRSSAGAVFALIAGLAIPVFACGLSAMLVLIASLQLREAAIEEVPLLVGTLLALGLLGLPLAWYAWRRMQGTPSTTWQARRGQRWAALAGGLVIVMLIGGQLAVSFNLAPALVLAPLQPLIFVLLAAILLILTVGDWSGMSRLRAWGHLLSGGWLAVFLSFMAEVIVVGLFAVVVVAILAVVVPEQLQPIFVRLQAMESVQSLSGPELNYWLDLALQPWVIGLVLLVVSFIIPVIEELFKPIGVILLLGRRPGPMAAFVGGVMGGVGYAVTETLGNLSSVNEFWIVLILARVGTLVMHGFTAGLVGWGWGEAVAGRLWRLLAAYASAVTIHGFWNGLVVAIVFGGLYMQRNLETHAVAATLSASAVAFCGLLLLVLVPACTLGLIWMGRALRSGAEEHREDPSTG